MKKISALLCSLVLVFSFVFPLQSVRAAEDPIVTVDNLVTEDRTPTITGSIANYISGGMVVYVEVVGAYVSLTDQIDSNGNWSMNIPNKLANGSYSVEAQVLDASTYEPVGEVGTGTLEVNYTHPQTPTVNLPGSYINSTNSSDFVFDGTAEESNMVICTFSDSDGNTISGPAFADSKGYFQFELDLSDLPDGPTGFSIFSVNDDGVASDSYDTTIQKDTIANATIVTQVHSPSSIDNPTVIINVEPDATWRISDGNIDYNVGNGSGNDEPVSLSGISAGHYDNVSLIVTDLAGNSKTILLAPFDITDSTGPTVNAGPDIITDKPVTIDAILSPSDENANIKWEKISGPGNITFGSDNTLSTTVSADQAGEYILRVSMPGEENCWDEVRFTWVCEPECSLTVDAGADISTDSTTSNLSATVTPSDDITSILWEKVSGPGNATFNPSDALSAAVTVDQPGTYVFKITVKNEDGCIATDELSLTFTVLPIVIPPATTTTTTTTTNNSDPTSTTVSLGTTLPEAGLPTIFYIYSAALAALIGVRKLVPEKKKK